MGSKDLDRQHVLVGVDGSPCSDIALRWAQRYAEATGADLELVTAWHYPTSYGVAMPLSGWDPEHDANTVIEKAFAQLTLSADRVHTHVDRGAAADALVRRSADADLLVVGSRGHGGFTGMLLGSVSTHCVHHARCPVVVVR
jgi:nucleotide-binding universal stress UspA family protein